MSCRRHQHEIKPHKHAAQHTSDVAVPRTAHIGPQQTYTAPHEALALVAALHDAQDGLGLGVLEARIEVLHDVVCHEPLVHLRANQHVDLNGQEQSVTVSDHVQAHDVRAGTFRLLHRSSGVRHSLYGLA